MQTYVNNILTHVLIQKCIVMTNNKDKSNVSVSSINLHTPKGFANVNMSTLEIIESDFQVKIVDGMYELESLSTF